MIDRTFGPYHIVDKLGEGGMGVVFLARDERLGRLVALKTIAPGGADDPDRLRRFGQEAATASALNHPNIVTIYDVGTADGVSYIAMEHVQGVTLSDLIGGGKLSLQRVLEISVQIADALAAAHRGGILHRDLKPGNIMLSDDRRAKVLDFGLAKLIAPPVGTEGEDTRGWSAVSTPETQAGLVMGTVSYMSPEQLRGGTIGPPSDVFALGCVLYAMVTGAPPFGTEGGVNTVAAILTDKPTPLEQVRPETPETLARIVDRCLQKDPKERPDASDVRQVLDALWRDDHAAATRHLRSVIPATPQSRARLAIASVVLLVSAIAGFAAWRWWPEPAVESPPISVLRRLTTDDGLSAFPAVSPDGTLMAFASDRAGAGALNLWIRQLAGGDAIQLTRGSTDDTHPSFSPDGSQIVFSSDRNGGGIFVVPTLGGEPRQLTSRGRRPRYSPDGQTIAYYTGPRSNSITDERIYLVPAAGGESVPFHPEFLSIRNPVWSPDGRSLLFMGRRDKSDRWPDDADWWIAAADGGGAAQQIGALEILGRQAFTDFTMPEVWDARNGILFSRRVADSSNVWRLMLSSDRRALPDLQQLTFGTGTEMEANILPAGGLVFTNYAERLNLWSLPIDAAGRVGDDLQPLTQGDTMAGSPMISVSGDQLVFIANRGAGRQVWVRDLRTASEAVLSPEGGAARGAVISRDGTRVAWQVTEKDGSHLYTTATTGGVPARACTGCGLVSNWTPDNRFLMYQSQVPSRFSLLDLATKVSRPLLVHPTRAVYSGNLSVDGEWLTFHAHVEDSAHGQQIYAAPMVQQPVAPNAWIPITSGEFEDDKPRWSVKGDAIYFTSLRDGYRCLWMQRVDPVSKQPTGPAESIRHFHSARLGMMFPDLALFGVSVARDRLVFTLVDRTAGIWMGTPAPAAK
jgi:serine/threonine protein kinase/Tol biopolymer transport system component